MNNGKIFHIFNKIFFEEIKKIEERNEQIDRWESSSFFSSSMKTKWHLSAIVSFSLSLLHFLQQKREKNNSRKKMSSRRENWHFYSNKKGKGIIWSDVVSIEFHSFTISTRKFRFQNKIIFFFRFSVEKNVMNRMRRFWSTYVNYQTCFKWK